METVLYDFQVSPFGFAPNPGLIAVALPLKSVLVRVGHGRRACSTGFKAKTPAMARIRYSG